VAKDEVPKSPYLPSIWVRLLYWFGIYFAAVYLYTDGQSILPRWSGLPDSLFWYFVVHFPQQLHLLIVGTLGLPLYGIISRVILISVYFLYLLNLALLFRYTGKRTYWTFITLLVVLIFLTFCGNEYYEADGVIYEHFSDKGALTPPP
jgi:hypothetical protein